MVLLYILPAHRQWLTSTNCIAWRKCYIEKFINTLLQMLWRWCKFKWFCLCFSIVMQHMMNILPQVIRLVNENWLVIQCSHLDLVVLTLFAFSLYYWRVFSQFCINTFLKTDDEAALNELERHDYIKVINDLKNTCSGGIVYNIVLETF